MRITDGNAAELLVDDEMPEAVVDAVRRARRSVHLTQLLFYPEFVARFRRRGLFARARPEGTLLDDLRAAGRRGARVRILLNENTLIPDTVKRFSLACEGDAGIEVRGLSLALNLLHAKVLVVDDEEAILVGPPFEQRFWDTPRHERDEPRRDSEKPMHDLSLRLRGPAVADVQRTFLELWRASGGTEPAAPIPSPPRTTPLRGNARIAITRTLPRGLLSPEAEHGILDSYLDAIARAQRFVYLETQYFTSPTIARAVGEALRRAPDLQVVLVLNEHMDIPGYDRWQEMRLAELGHPHEPRLGAFHLRDVYVHSKLGVVDDEWATVGSANLDSISLEEAEEFGPRSEPNVDVNAVVLDPEWAAAARRRVWAEILGDQGVWRADPPPGGWLALWRRCAAQNLERLVDGRPMRGHVLPYGHEQVLRT